MDRFHTLTAVTLAWLTLAGCASFSPRPDPSRFFTLAALSQAEEPLGKNPAGQEQISLGVGPVKFPGYLDREQVVTRVARNRLDLSENDRWAEPLEENFTRVLAQNLSALLRSDKILRYPWLNRQRPSYQVEIEVLRFESDSAQDAELSARWAVIDSGSKKSLTVKESRLMRRAQGKSTEASVAALSEALEGLSREIAESIRAIAGQRKP